jgi:hypothetical protein
MYVFLLLLGAASTAAGLVLVASGMAHDGVYAITPGMIAIVGGLILIGLALVVRELQRIERALAARPMPRAARPREAPAAAAERQTGEARIPFPPRPKTESYLQSGNAPASAEQEAFVSLREKFPTLVRLENAPVVEDTNVSLSPGPPARAEEVVGEGETRTAVGARAGGGAPARVAPRLDANARSSRAPERPKGSMFDAFWPKGQRVRRDTQTATAQAVAPPSVEPVQGSEAAPESHPAAAEPRQAAAEVRPVAAERPAPAAVSILKSGVVEGMAYTLYSDGSIEAQLPQGILRFGSITELRSHIENES